MARLNIKNIFILSLVLIIVWCSIGVYNLEIQRNDREFLGSWSIATEREGVIERVNRNYFPFELLCYLAGAYYIYMLLTGWGSELFDGRVFRSIPYFALTVLGAIYSIHTYTVVGQVRSMVASKGIIPDIGILLLPFAKLFAIGLVIQIFKYGIQKEFYKESEKVKGSEYYNNWIEMSEKIKKNIK